jgi:hypothetical protein
MRRDRAPHGEYLLMALSTFFDPADAYVAWLARDGGDWEIVCSASTEELCRKRLEDWAAIHQPCEVRVLPAGKKPTRRPRRKM